MMLPFILVIALIVAVVQMVLCFCAKRWWVKVIPLGVLVIGDMVCWGVYASSVFSQIYGADFAAYIYGILLAVFAVVDILCLGFYGIVRKMKK